MPNQRAALKHMSDEIGENHFASENERYASRYLYFRISNFMTTPKVFQRGPE